MRLVDLTGKRFNKLLVLRRGTKTPAGVIRWVCLCDCGRTKEISGQNLRTGLAYACGCKMAQVTHGKSRTPEFMAWSGMLQRCSNPNAKSYPNYGGRGIQVCDRWNPAKGGSFENFLEDMGTRPSEDLSIDRIDNSGPYSSGNCRWTDRKTQLRNTRKNTFISFEGEELCLAAWAERLGVWSSTLLSRLKRWPLQVAMTTRGDASKEALSAIRRHVREQRREVA